LSSVDDEALEELTSEMAKSYDMRTICEVLREIYWTSRDPEVRNLVLEATIMAKKMDRKLIEYYHRKWYRKPEFYEANPNSKEKAKMRRARELQEASQKTDS
jgi:hypothetical protein